MNSGALFAQQFGLRPGIALTAAQMAQLTSDIVWLVEQAVTLPDGTRTTVLAPQVYVRVRSDDLHRDGSLIAGDATRLKLQGDLVNGGRIAGRTAVAITAQNISNLGGLIQGGNVAVRAQQDLINRGGVIQGKDRLVVSAGRDLIVEATKDYAPDRLAGLYVSNPNGVLLASAGRDLSVLGAAQVRSAGDVALSAGRDLSIASRVGDTTTTGFGKNRDTRQSLDVASVSAGGNLVLSGGRDVQLTAAQLEAGKSAAVVAGRDIVSTTLTTTDTSDREVNAGKTKTISQTVDETLHGTTTRSGGDVALLAGRDIALTAATVRSDAGAVALSAVRDVNLLAGKESHSLVEDSTSKKKGFLNNTTTKTHTEVHDTNAIGTMLSGESVAIQAGRDVAGQGTQVVGTGDVVIAAGRDLTLDAAESTHSELFTVDKKKSGLMSGMGSGIGVTIGSRKQGQSSELHQTSAVGSVVGSLEGNVTLAAGNDLAVRGSDVISAAGTQLVGQNVTIASAQQISDMTESSYFKQSGLNIAIGGGVVDSALGAYRAAKRGSEVKDDRLAGLYAAQAAYAAKDTVYGVQGIQSGTSSASGGVNVRITVGSQSSDSKTVVHEVTQRGSSLTSGGDIVIVATGDGQGNGGDLSIQGSTIEGQNVALAAARDLNIASSQNSYESESRSKSQGGEIGVAISADSGGGAAAGLYLSANAARAKGDGEGVSHNESQIRARDTLSFSSGRDTTLKGAQLAAETVIGDVGRNLTLISEQDTDTYKNRSASVQGEMTIGYGFTGSASASASKIDSDYASVKEQTGIQAGAGGFDITVGEHTQLTGAAIASTATPDKNRLSTNSLSATDIQNKAEYSAMSVSLSTSGGQAGSAPAGSNVYSAPTGGGSVSPGMGVPQNEDSRSTTRSGISAGSVDVRNGDVTAMASIDRSVTILEQSGLKSIFDEQKVNEKMELGDMALKVGFRTAGAISERMQNAAIKDIDAARRELDAATDEVALQAAQSRLDAAAARLKQWSDGGANKTALHTITGALAATFGGGNVAGGALGAGSAEAIRGETAGLDKTAQEFLSLIAGGVAGGGAGAATGLAGEQFNRQLHDKEIGLLALSAAEFQRQMEGQGIEMTVEDAFARLMAQALRRTDSVEIQNRTWDLPAQAFLDLLGKNLPAFNVEGKTYKFFVATSKQERDDHELFANTRVDYGAFYDIAQASEPYNNAYSMLGYRFGEGALIQDWKGRFAYNGRIDEVIQTNLEAITLGFAAQIAAPAISSAVKDIGKEGVLLYCLSRPGLCDGAGVLAVDTVAGITSGYPGAPFGPSYLPSAALARKELMLGRLTARDYLMAVQAAKQEIVTLDRVTALVADDVAKLSASGLSRLEQFKSLSSGFSANGVRFTINPHAISSLQKSGRRSIDVSAMLRALSTDSKPGVPGSVMYVDPKTEVKFFVSDKGEVVGVQPPGFR